jgi:arabinogalactan endo-1,4-beta-galactosidase
MNVKHVITLFLFSLFLESRAQPFYFGVDLSYLNEMEACGAVYKKDGTPINVYGLFADQGANLVRLRLWHTPSWYDALNQGERYSDFEDVRLAISRAKTLGFQVLLDFHLSDTWADPGHQVVPAAWAAVVDDQNVLADSLHNYIYETLTKLGNEGLLPDIVQIGNETNRGILLSQEVNDQGWTLDWQRNVILFQAAAEAIDDVALQLGIPIRKAIHIADPEDVEWYIGQFVLHGFANFDIIGISYYWQWHQPVTIPQAGQIIASLKEDYPDKDVMIFETAYGWTTQNADGANNILFNTHPSYSPLSPANQLKWMTDLTQTVINHGGKGVIYWEPAWISTGCATQWVTGSSWDNATFFDFANDVIADGGIGWMSHPYDFPSSIGDVLNTAQRLDFFYADEQIIIRNTSHLHLNFPLNILLSAPDGRVILSRKIASANEESIRIPVQGLLPGCYMVSIRDNTLVNATGMICIPK